MTKKGKFWALKWKLFPKNRSFEKLVRKYILVAPKLGAESPPMIIIEASSPFRLDYSI